MDNIPNRMNASTAQDLLANCFARDPLNPIVYAMVGVPGAGKSTFVKQQLAADVFPKDAFMLNPDLVLRQMPEFQVDRAERGEKLAAQKWEKPERLLAMAIIDQLILQKCDVIIDMGQVRQENWDVLKRFKQAGFQISLYPIFAPLEVCAKRLAMRAETQFFPVNELVERARNLAELYPKNSHIADSVAAYGSQNGIFTPLSDFPTKLCEYLQTPFDLLLETDNVKSIII